VSSRDQEETVSRVFQLETLLGWLERTMHLRGIRRHTWRKDETELSYHVAGREDREHTIVLVHGLGASTLSWVKVFGALARRHRVYAIDLPGWGRSPMPVGKDFASIPDQTLAVTRFLDSLPKRPVVLVGQSMGGWVCAKVAAARSDLVEQLVLCNNAGVLYPDVEELRKALDLKSQDEVERFWESLWHKVPGFYRFFTADYVAKMQAPRVLRFFDSLQEQDFINEDLPKLAMPVSIIWGMSDRFIPIKTVDLMLPHLQDARVYWIPECGHVAALERPKEFVRILDGILQREIQPQPDLV
jgi:pimeloyl-ACP methyl ester carboxylesterase